MSHRTQITLSDDQYTRLKQESERTGMGLAELVRRALVAAYGPAAPEDAQQVLDKSFGTWGDRDFDGEQYVDRMRPGMAVRLSR